MIAGARPPAFHVPSPRHVTRVTRDLAPPSPDIRPPPEARRGTPQVLSSLTVENGRMARSTIDDLTRLAKFASCWEVLVCARVGFLHASICCHVELTARLGHLRKSEAGEGLCNGHVAGMHERFDELILVVCLELVDTREEHRLHHGGGEVVNLHQVVQPENKGARVAHLVGWRLGMQHINKLRLTHSSMARVLEM